MSEKGGLANADAERPKRRVTCSREDIRKHRVFAVFVAESLLRIVMFSARAQLRCEIQKWILSFLFSAPCTRGTYLCYGTAREDGRHGQFECILSCLTVQERWPRQSQSQNTKHQA